MWLVFLRRYWLKLVGFTLVLFTLYQAYDYGYSSASNKYLTKMNTENQDLVKRLQEADKRTNEIETKYINELQELRKKKDKARVEIKEVIKQSKDKCLSTDIDSNLLERLRDN